MFSKQTDRQRQKSLLKISLLFPLNSSSSFTLIELLIVIAIIGVLVATIAPRYVDFTTSAEVKTIANNFKAINTAINMYHFDTGQWPTCDNNNDATLEKKQFITGEGQPSGWDGPYLQKWPETSWGEPYLLKDDDWAGGDVDGVNFQLAVVIHEWTQWEHEDIAKQVDDLLDNDGDLSDTTGGIFGYNGWNFVYAAR